MLSLCKVAEAITSELIHQTERIINHIKDPVIMMGIMNHFIVSVCYFPSLFFHMLSGFSSCILNFARLYTIYEVAS